MKKAGTNKTKVIQQLIGKMQVLKYHSPVCENISRVLPHWDWEIDVCSVSKSGMVYDFEVKISRSDFKADAKKAKHIAYREKHHNKIPNYFSYVCPDGMIKTEEIPEYAGLYYYLTDNCLLEVKKPKRIHDFAHDIKVIQEKICRVQSERLFLGCCRLTHENNERAERYKVYENSIKP